MADYDDLTVGQLVETAAHINGWQKLRRLVMGTTKLHDMADGSQLVYVTGTYTGDGAATKAITGVGFQPRAVLIYGQADGVSGYPVVKTDQDGLYASLIANYETDHITAFGADGFTVGDGTGSSLGNTTNVNLRVYTYIALR